MAYQLGGALAGLYDPDDLEPLVTPYQKLRLGLEPPRSSPFYDVESELASRAAPVLHRNLAQDGDDGQGTRAVTYELIDQLLRARNARTINQPDARDKLRTPEQVSEASRGPSFTEKAIFDYAPRAVEFTNDMMKPQIFHEYMTDAEKNWKEGNYGSAAAYLGLAPFGALADVAGSALLPGVVEKNLGAGAARALSWAGKAADDALGGGRMAAGAGLTAGGAAMLPSDAEAGAPKWYSPLRKMIEDAPQSKATLDQWMGYLTNRPGVKKEELEYTFGSKAKDANLLENLAGESQPITKRELLRHFDENDVPVEEVFYGNPLSRDERSKLVEMQNMTDDVMTPDQLMDRQDLEFRVERSKLPKYPGSEYSLPGEASNYREIAVTSPRAEWDPNISEGHFGPIPGEDTKFNNKAKQQIGWIRGDVRKLEDGSRAFHVDEFQSDPAQRALKRGWAGAKSELDDIEEMAARENWNFDEALTDQNHPGHQAALRHRALEQSGSRPAQDGVPDRPWKKDWPKLLFRRALWEAVQEDADHLTWTPADIQQKRWGGAQLGRDRLYEETIPKIAAEEAKRLGLPKEAVGEVKGGQIKPNEGDLDNISGQLAVIENTYSKPQSRRDELEAMMDQLGLDFETKKKALGVDPTLDEWYQIVENLLTEAVLQKSKNEGRSARLYSLKLTPEVRKRILADGLPKFVGAGVAPSLLDRFLSEEP